MADRPSPYLRAGPDLALALRMAAAIQDFGYRPADIRPWLDARYQGNNNHNWQLGICAFDLLQQHEVLNLSTEAITDIVTRERNITRERWTGHIGGIDQALHHKLGGFTEHRPTAPPPSERAKNTALLLAGLSLDLSKGN